MITTNVSDYAREGVLDYPSRRTETSFISDGESVFHLSADNAVAITQIERYLSDHDLPSLEERIPVLAYGANVSPGNLGTKFDKYSTDGTSVTSEEMKTVPSLYATISGSDVVWHGGPGGYAGGYYAEIYQGEETKDTTVKVAVQFLTPEQLAVMHTTEGDTYGISIIKDVDLGNGMKIDAVSYVARQASILLDDNAKPIAVKGVERQGSDLDIMDPQRALDYTLSTDTVKKFLGDMTAEHYVRSNTELSAKEKSARSLAVKAALASEGRNRQMRHPTLETDNMGRANFVSLPRGVKGQHKNPADLELLEQSVAKIRPNKEEFTRRMAATLVSKPGISERGRGMLADPVLKLRDQATTELLDPEREKALARSTSRRLETDDKIEKR